MFQPMYGFSGFSVKDLAETERFYTKTLGLKAETGPSGLQISLPGGASVFAYPKGEDHQPATFTILNFKVKNVDEAVAELGRRGVTFERYEGMTDESGVARGLAHDRGPDIAWFQDPSGNILSVLQDEK